MSDEAGQGEQMCMVKGEPVSPTFTPICTLPEGHDGDHNWEERIAERNRLREEAAARRAEPEPEEPQPPEVVELAELGMMRLTATPRAFEIEVAEPDPPEGGGPRDDPYVVMKMVSAPRHQIAVRVNLDEFEQLCSEGLKVLRAYNQQSRRLKPATVADMAKLGKQKPRGRR